MIRFDSTKEDASVIRGIADRAACSAKEAGWNYAMRDAEMDITACHLNGCPLRLKELLDAGDFDFSHDVFGIRRHLDRKTGKLKGFFSPRFAEPQGVAK